MRPSEFTQERRVSVTGTELAASMAAVIGARLRKSGVGMQEADEIALGVMEEVRSQYGGQNVYFAREDRTKHTERANEIYGRFMSNELGVPELAQTYGYSVQWIYHVIRTVRARRRAEREAEAAEKRDTDHQRWKREGGIGDDL
ncbi:MAG: hypothetical protein I8H73_07150 [Pseudomonadales bacterium]|nr:hypothetical protein [Pseudomonadales bacterium]